MLKKFNLTQVFHFIREISGDDAYERYLRHWQTYHAEHEAQPLTREAFFKAELERKWNGVKRCC